MRPVGDLDGDGAEDLVSLTREGEQELGRKLVLRGRRGSDGTELFVTDTGLEGSLVLVSGQPVGPEGEAGVLLATYTYGTATGPLPATGPYGERPFGWEGVAVDIGLHLAAVSGDGSVAWSRSFTGGRLVYTGLTLAAVEDLPILAGPLDAVAGPATDVALAVYDRAPAPGGGQDDALTQDDAVQVLTIDGTDGTDAASLELDIDNTEAPLDIVPDLDGNGLDDLLVRLMPAGGTTPVEVDTLLAARGSDGAELWRSTAAPLGRRTTVRSLGDATGDGISDLAVGEPGYRAQNDPLRQVFLLDGASGQTLIAPESDTSRPLGDIDQDGLADVFLSSASLMASSVEVVHRAVDAGGDTLWERSFALEGYQSPGASLLAPPGDVDGDGITDFAHRLRVRASATCCEELVESRILSGRTGDTIRAGEPLGSPLRASLDGAGDDVALVDPFGPSVVDVTAADGRTGEPLFTTRLRPRGQTTGSRSVVSADVTGDGTPDIVVNTLGTTPPEPEEMVSLSGSSFADGYVLDGRTGSVVWMTDSPGVPPEPDLRGVASTDASFSWPGTAATGLNVNYFGMISTLPSERCSPDDPIARCEHVLVEFVNEPPAGEASAMATATISIDQFGPVPEPATDLDLIVYESDELGTVGPLADESPTFGNVPAAGEEVAFEVATTPEQPSRFYLVRVVYYTSVESGYRGTASLS